MRGHRPLVFIGLDYQFVYSGFIFRPEIFFVEESMVIGSAIGRTLLR